MLYPTFTLTTTVETWFSVYRWECAGNQDADDPPGGWGGVLTGQPQETHPFFRHTYTADQVLRQLQSQGRCRANRSDITGMCFHHSEIIWRSNLAFRVYFFSLRNDIFFLGFRTAKGELVRAILFPKPLDMKFYRDAMKFLLFLGCMAALGMTYSIIIYVKQGVSTNWHREICLTSY